MIHLGKRRKRDLKKVLEVQKLQKRGLVKRALPIKPRRLDLVRKDRKGLKSQVASRQNSLQERLLNQLQSRYQSRLQRLDLGQIKRPSQLEMLGQDQIKKAREGQVRLDQARLDQIRRQSSLKRGQTRRSDQQKEGLETLRPFLRLSYMDLPCL